MGDVWEDPWGGLRSHFRGWLCGHPRSGVLCAGPRLRHEEGKEHSALWLVVDTAQKVALTTQSSSGVSCWGESGCPGCP